ncbi:hypothetical protein Mgra_00001682 [Meloidogyne graminicola]|uniref:Uncharacterized protein n=1 Tax=Meloidogyne graminicola TaxID=189291 RepID=A0A8T0A190_9BILA|nr:hypothetical protein Mgra_00001682 [Meloidogyne graminicola]
MKYNINTLQNFVLTIIFLIQLFTVQSFDYEIRQFGPSQNNIPGISQRSLFVDSEINSEDNAGFLGNLPSGRRRLIQPPPLKRNNILTNFKRK